MLPPLQGHWQLKSTGAGQNTRSGLQYCTHIKYFPSEFAPSVAREHDWTQRRLLFALFAFASTNLCTYPINVGIFLQNIMGLPLVVSLVSVSRKGFSAIEKFPVDKFCSEYLCEASLC